MGCVWSCERIWLLDGVSCLGGALGREDEDCSSGIEKDMMSTMLDTSFLTFSGKVAGRSLPLSFRLHKYIERANSGKSSWPDLVVSERVLEGYISTVLLLSSGLVCSPDLRQCIAR